nr:unnamed protein product [Trichobilharzia regenti]
MQKKPKYKIWLSEFIQLCKHHLPSVSEEVNTVETLSDKDYQLIEDTLKNIIEDIQQKIQILHKENNEMENILVDAQTISQSFSTKVKPSITGQRLYYLKSQYHDFGINDATNLKQMKRLRDYLCKTKLTLEKSLQEDYKLKSDIATSQKNVQHLIEKVNCQKKVNKALKQRIERLKVCLNSWKLEQERLPAKCIGECILVALYNHINLGKNKVGHDDDLSLSLSSDLSTKGNNSQNIENNVNSQHQEMSSPSLSKRCSITVTQFTQLLQTGRNNEAFSLTSECGEENCDLLTQLFKVCENEKKTTEYPENELFNLLLKCNCPHSADIFHHLLKNDKISWKSFGLLLEEQMHKINSSLENNIDDSYGNMRVTVLLADLVNILLSDVELKDQHKILEMIVQKLKINSVSFWKNLLENNPSSCRDVCKLCGAFEIVKVRQLHIRRMVHLVQLAISGISTVDTSPD